MYLFSFFMVPATSATSEKKATVREHGICSRPGGQRQKFSSNPSHEDQPSHTLSETLQHEKKKNFFCIWSYSVVFAMVSLRWQVKASYVVGKNNFD